MRTKEELDSMAVSYRAELHEDALSPINIFAAAASIDNLTLTFYPLGKNISGLCIKGERSIFIAINSETSLGRQRFSLAHELYHLRYDEALSKNVSRMEIGSGTEPEREADLFASHFLLPAAALYKWLEGRSVVTVADVVRMEQYFGLSRSAMLYRLIEDGKLSRENAESMRTNVRESALRLGYDTALYYPAPEGKRIRTVGEYIRLANRLHDGGKLSTGRYESLLLDVFRDDLVYGEEETEVDPVD